MTHLLTELYDPSSPEYRRFLTVEQFSERFGPTAQDYKAALDFATANDLAITNKPANRLVIPVRGTVAQIERAFHVRINSYQHPIENRFFYSLDREPSFPVGVHVQHIAGLNNASLPRPMLRRLATNRIQPANIIGSGPEGSYVASDMRAAYYGDSTLTGKGQTVGLVEFDGYNPSDVQLTFKSSGQSFDGIDGSPAHGDDGEDVLDIAQAIGMAPGLSQVRVYIGNLDASILNAIASENIAKQVSISWTWNPDDPETDDIFFQEMAAQGQSVFVASGDYGEYDPYVDFFYPAEDAYVTAVGGTSLVTDGAGGTWGSEIAWSHSGGGISPDNIPLPDWQIGVANSSNGGSNALRNVPDVAMEADFDNFNCDMGQCAGTWGGTSFAAARWAAFMALINEQAENSGNAPVGFLNPLLYQIGAGPSYSAVFHDITVGNNNQYAIAPRPFFYAVPGYDLVTGWGTPVGQSIVGFIVPSRAPGLQLTVSQSHVSIEPGGTTSVSIKPSSGTDKASGVLLTLTALPDGITSSFSKNPTAGETILTLTATGSVARGSYLISVTGTSGDLTASASFALEVDAPGFTITPSPGSIKVYQGSSGSTSLTTSMFSGFSGEVEFAITSQLPDGVTCYLTTDPKTQSRVLTITASDIATPGSEMLTITGRSGGAIATATVALSVNRPVFASKPCFNLAFSSASSLQSLLIPAKRSPVSRLWSRSFIPRGN